MQENRQGDLKGCECLHSDCSSLIPGKEKGKDSWEQNCLKVLSNQRTAEQGWGESVNQSWPSEESHALQPSTYRHISVLRSSWWRAAPGILCQGADGFRAHQQGSWFSGIPWRQWSWPPWPPSSALAQDICAPWQVGIWVDLEKGWRSIFLPAWQETG